MFQLTLSVEDSGVVRSVDFPVVLLGELAETHETHDVDNSGTRKKLKIQVTEFGCFSLKDRENGEGWNRLSWLFCFRWLTTADRYVYFELRTFGSEVRFISYSKSIVKLCFFGHSIKYLKYLKLKR